MEYLIGKRGKHYQKLIVMGLFIFAATAVIGIGGLRNMAEGSQIIIKVEDGRGKELSNGDTTPSKTVEIKFIAPDILLCSLDGPGQSFDRPLSDCPPGHIELSKLISGTYAFNLRSTDGAGNIEEQETFTWTVK